MKLYLSGPVAGYLEYNETLFATNTQLLRDAGYQVVNPLDVERKVGLTWADYLRADLAALLQCEAVAVLPYWGASRGACLEVHVAQQLGMVVLPVHVWIEREQVYRE